MPRRIICSLNGIDKKYIENIVKNINSILKPFKSTEIIFIENIDKVKALFNHIDVDRSIEILEKKVLDKNRDDFKELVIIDPYSSNHIDKYSRIIAYGYSLIFNDTKIIDLTDIGSREDKDDAINLLRKLANLTYHLSQIYNLFSKGENIEAQFGHLGKVLAVILSMNKKYGIKFNINPSILYLCENGGKAAAEIILTTYRLLINRLNKIIERVDKNILWRAERITIISDIPYDLSSSLSIIGTSLIPLKAADRIILSSLISMEKPFSANLLITYTNPQKDILKEYGKEIKEKIEEIGDVEKIFLEKELSNPIIFLNILGNIGSDITILYTHGGPSGDRWGIQLCSQRIGKIYYYNIIDAETIGEYFLPKRFTYIIATTCNSLDAFINTFTSGIRGFIGTRWIVDGMISAQIISQLLEKIMKSQNISKSLCNIKNNTKNKPIYYKPTNLPETIEYLTSTSFFQAAPSRTTIRKIHKNAIKDIYTSTEYITDLVLAAENLKSTELENFIEKIVKEKLDKNKEILKKQTNTQQSFHK